MPLTQQRHYTVGYHDLKQHKYEICEYAMSAYDAIENSKKDVPELQVHPSFVDYCKDSPKEIDTISRMMAAGIPMGR